MSTRIAPWVDGRNKGIKPEDIIETVTKAKVVRNVGHAGAPCLGYHSLQGLDGKLIEVPGWEFPAGSELTIEIRVVVTKRAKEPRKKRLNPWPSHRCPDGSTPNRRKKRP